MSLHEGANYLLKHLLWLSVTFIRYHIHNLLLTMKRKIQNINLNINRNIFLRNKNVLPLPITWLILGIPIIYILLTVPQILPWSTAELRFLSWCHIAGILSPWIGSCLYHIFMSADRGEHFYYILLQIDMLGIWICQSFGGSCQLQ